MTILSDRQITSLCVKGEDKPEDWKPLIQPFYDHLVNKHYSVTAKMGNRDHVIEIPEQIAQSMDLELDKHKSRRIISYGLSSFGYDVRLANKFKIFTNINSGIIDPLNMSDDCYVDFEGDECIIPPNSYVLGHTVEVFSIPRDIQVICVGKSTYARAGCAINVTPVEAGFVGQVVIEIANLTPLPMKVHANMGIAQFLFFQGSEECITSYADRAGKYQNQTGITTVRI